MAARNHHSLFHMSKVKAHQTITADMPAAARRAAAGNDMADGAAKQGALLHPQPSSVEKVMGMFSWRMLVECATAIGSILPLFPTALEQFGGRLSRVASRGWGGVAEDVSKQRSWTLLADTGSLRLVEPSCVKHA